MGSKNISVVDKELNIFSNKFDMFVKVGTVKVAKEDLKSEVDFIKAFPIIGLLVAAILLSGCVSETELNATKVTISKGDERLDVLVHEGRFRSGNVIETGEYVTICWLSSSNDEVSNIFNTYLSECSNVRGSAGKSLKEIVLDKLLDGIELFKDLDKDLISEDTIGVLRNFRADPSVVAEETPIRVTVVMTHHTDFSRCLDSITIEYKDAGGTFLGHHTESLMECD